MSFLSRYFPEAAFEGAVKRILELQRADGSIPWYDKGVWDPWNHTHAAIGLALAGRITEAECAYEALANRQNTDGSWWAQYGAAVPLDQNRYDGTGDEPHVRDTNYCAYPVTGILHHYRLTGDLAFLKRYWPMIRSSIDFVLALQSDHGEIRWSAPDPGTPQDDALVTGSSSIYKSLECAIAAARVLNEPAGHWQSARARLGEALREKPHRFDRQWEKKSYFAMDWYYPVLAGVYRGPDARARIEGRWSTFVAEGKGCRCVEHEPWVTIAESCELVLALLSIGDHARAQALWSWQEQWKGPCGAYWMGWQYEKDVPWPEERPAWTNAAVIIAADALSGATDATRMLYESSL